MHMQRTAETTTSNSEHKTDGKNHQILKSICANTFVWHCWMANKTSSSGGIIGKRIHASYNSASMRARCVALVCPSGRRLCGRASSWAVPQLMIRLNDLSADITINRVADSALTRLDLLTENETKQKAWKKISPKKSKKLKLQIGRNFNWISFCCVYII